MILTGQALDRILALNSYAVLGKNYGGLYNKLLLLKKFEQDAKKKREGVSKYAMIVCYFKVYI